MANPKIDGLVAYAGDYQEKLITQLYDTLDTAATGITVIPNLKSKLNLPKLVVEPGLKPFTGVFKSKDDVSFGQRVLTVEKAQRDLNVNPSKYLATFMEKKRGKGENAKNMTIPFAEVMWPAVIDEISQEVVQGSIYHGVGKAAFAAYNPASTYAVGARITYTQDGEVRYFKCIAATTAGQNPDTNAAKWKWDGAAALTVGFKGLLDTEVSAGSVVPVSTGAITSADAYGQFTNVWRKLPEVVKSKGGIIYCSQNSMEALLDDYENKIKKNFEETNGIVYLAKTEKKAIIKPVNWMSGSSRIIASAAGNLWMGTDQTDDANIINTIPQMYSVDAGITFMIGFQIADPSALVINDQA